MTLLRKALVVLVSGAVVVACATEETPSGGPSGGPQSRTEKVQRYGYGPERDNGFTYQPDVVLIEGGPEAILAVTPDGLVWTMDGDAGGVEDLEPGKIMFASSGAAGRVVQVSSKGGDRVVTLGPVGLTDIVRDGRLTLDRDIDLASLSFQSFDDLPGAFGGEEGAALLPSAAAASGSVIELPPVLLAAATGDKPGEAVERSKTFGDWTVTAYKSATALGLKAERGLAKEGLKIQLDAHLVVNDLHITTDVPITAGQVGHSGFQMTGVTGIVAELKGGAGNGLADNRKVKIALPIELKEPILLAGFPATLIQKFKFLVETGFSAKNGNLTARGTWAVDGPLGFDGTNLVTPTVTPKEKLIESLQGVSVGINSVVASVSFETGLQVGLPVAAAGPYARLIATVTLLNGSAIGIVKCRQSTFLLELKSGVGISVYSPAKTVIQKLFGIVIPEEAPLPTKEVYKRPTDYLPKVPVCQP